MGMSSSSSKWLRISSRIEVARKGKRRPIRRAGEIPALFNSSIRHPLTYPTRADGSRIPSARLEHRSNRLRPRGEVDSCERGIKALDVGQRKPAKRDAGGRHAGR
jgi:hypothetical protein